jgi:hypothetical protein
VTAGPSPHHSRMSSLEKAQVQPAHTVPTAIVTPRVIETIIKSLKL